jgi:hypothetical protein
MISFYVKKNKLIDRNTVKRHSVYKEHSFFVIITFP